MRPACLELIDERAVDLLDIDAPVLHRLESIGPLKQLACGGVGVGKRARLGDTCFAIL